MTARFLDGEPVLCVSFPSLGVGKLLRRENYAQRSAHRIHECAAQGAKKAAFFMVFTSLLTSDFRRILQATVQMKSK